MQAGTIVWFARHESRLAWRDWLSMMTAGKRERWRLAAVAIFSFATFMHFVAYTMVARYAEIGAPDKVTLVTVTGCLMLMFLLMVSQAMESVTRAFYSRSDLDLILSSPVAARRLFVVRIATIAGTIVLMAGFLASPFINVLAVLGGAHWLSAYGVVAGMGALAAVLALALTIALFRIIGPKRTRLIAQVIAAVIGAGFIIGLQVAAIQSYGSLSRIAVLQSDALVGHAPAIESLVYWPARAVLGDMQSLMVVLAVSTAALVLAVIVFSARFGDHAAAAAGVATTGARRRRNATFVPAAPRRALRHKEWTLLLRDPWLVSQSLIQLLYLLPPALMLWKSFASGTGASLLLVPVFVMAAGQLAGGLAWLAISGEDAPDLVATAPIPPEWVLRAKVEAVLGAIVIVFGPFVAAMALVSPADAMIAGIGVIASGMAATLVQVWFRAQAKRRYFRRRQTSSRVATFAEAFSSITIAATAGLAAAGAGIFAAITCLLAIAVLGAARLVAPRA